MGGEHSQLWYADKEEKNGYTYRCCSNAASLSLGESCKMEPGCSCLEQHQGSCLPSTGHVIVISIDKAMMH